MIDCGAVLWDLRDELTASRSRLCELSALVDARADLNLGQWVQLYAMALQFQPDLIVDLGRGFGNSTCLFTEAAHKIGSAHVVSIGFHDDHAWAVRTEPSLRNALPTSWFDSLTIMEQDLRRIDFRLVFGQAQRILIFWDMLGYGVSRHVLNNVLPLIGARQHLVIVKDVTDGRYHRVEDAYRSAGLLSPTSEVRTLGGFLLRNGIEYQTAEHCLRVWREQHQIEVAAFEDAWGQDMPPPDPLRAGDWIYFELPARLKPPPSVFRRIQQLVAVTL